MDFINQAAQAFTHQQGASSQSSDPPHQSQSQGQGHHPPYQSSPQHQNNGLPPGWIQEWDAPDNRYFYINQRTGERTFNRPSAPHQGPPPSDPNHNLPPGWVAEWDAPDHRWFFVNQRTGERTWNHPGGPPPQAQYTEVYTSGRGPMGSTYQQSEVITQTQAPQKKNHNMAYGAGGAVAGLAAGALLMHEGHKVEEHWERDKDKFEDDFEGRRRYEDEGRGYGGDGYGRRGGDTIIENQTIVDDNDRYGGGYPRQDNTIIENETIVNDDRYDDRRGGDTFIQNETIVDDSQYGGRDEYNQTVVRDDGYDDGYRRDEYRDDGFVDDAARWTGDKVQEVEDIPDDAARWTGDKVQEVEDIPDDVARWTGDKFQEVEDIPQDIEGSFDEGRDDRRDYDDSRDYDDDRY